MIFQVDLRPNLPPIRDQGPRGTCLAFAITGAHETERENGTSTLDLSEEALYWKGRLLSGLQSGMRYDAAAKALNEQGQPEEALWPYDSECNDKAPGYVPPPGAISHLSCFHAVLNKIDTTVDAAKTGLNQKRVVVVGVTMSRPFYERTRGLIRMPLPAEMIKDGHAIVLVGYADSNGQGSSGYFVFRNSWGLAWGDEGYGYLPYDYLSCYGTGAFLLQPT